MNEWSLAEGCIDNFIQSFKEKKNKGTLTDFSTEEKCNFYLRLLTQLYEGLKMWIETNNKFNYEKNLHTFEAIFLLKMPMSLGEDISALYESSFEVYCSSNKKLFPVNEEASFDEENLDNGFCIACNQDTGCCRCKHVLTLYSSITKVLYKLRLYEHILFPAIINVAHNQLSKFIEKHCKGQYFELWLERVLEWTEQGLLNWLQFCTCSDSESLNEYFTIEDWKPKMIFFVHKVFAELRISELFEIIVEYPDSLPAINDLKNCIYITQTRQYLTESLKKAFENRLLHPAVNTDDILTQYVSTIRTLRELDPAGVILENVCAPLREYLRNREDTIKCIITCITDEESGPDLVEELISSDVGGEYNSDHESDGEDWVPDPIDAKTDLSSRKQRTADIINILVNVYGSQDMFVSQYRILLADRILTNFNYSVSNERRYLELLKRRFGENHLHFCDIMLKDIQDSQRINRLIKDDASKQCAIEQQIDFNAFILSSTFWPTFSDESVDPPEEVKSLMTNYTESFKQLKGMRTLDWINNLGSVELEVELQDGVKNFNVTPAQATLLLTFQKKDEWTLSELSRETSVNKTSLRNRISFWVGQGVIVEKPNDVYVTASCFQSQNQKDTTLYDSEEENVAFSQNQKEEELHVYWSYVVGMLTNIGSLPLERIHSMLKMFATHGESSSHCSLEEVKAFLCSKINDGELTYVGGMYKLPKGA
ncbi:anaphase-promoting complex subunit 2 isoform X1 [Hydra vulgaris]|uniref:Anaphase-promoting complex subunit 2 n=1 Tax=Hydra vulgaris TaxID=6087 RepID=T2M430_HYDVU|nr:anaphase-promoting complex subunit 2 isoform X2 [Hydra vulgaris]